MNSMANPGCIDFVYCRLVSPNKGYNKQYRQDTLGQSYVQGAAEECHCCVVYSVEEYTGGLYALCTLYSFGVVA